jgi:hypothetical protein
MFSRIDGVGLTNKHSDKRIAEPDPLSVRRSNLRRFMDKSS